MIISMIPSPDDIFKNKNIIDFTLKGDTETNYLIDDNGKYIVDEQFKYIILNNE